MLLADLVENTQSSHGPLPVVHGLPGNPRKWLRVLPGQNAPRVNSPRNISSLNAKNEPKQLKSGLKRRFNSPRAMWMLLVLVSTVHGKAGAEAGRSVLPFGRP